MSQNVPNEKDIEQVTLIGPEGCGKTCFLAGLSWLSANVQESDCQITPSDRETAEYFNILYRTFNRGTWIPATGVTTLLDFTINDIRQKRWQRVLCIDYPGEDFRKSFSSMTQERIETFCLHLYRSKVILFLIDSHEMVVATTQEKKDALNERLRTNLDAVFHTIEEYVKNTEQVKTEHLDFCVVLTKADQVPDLWNIREQPEKIQKFVQKYTGKFEEKLFQTIRVRSIQYFAVSSVGPDAINEENGQIRLVPPKITPTGYETLFRWVSERRARLWWEQFRRYCRMGMMIILLLFLLMWGGIVVFNGVKKDQEEQQVAVALSKSTPIEVVIAVEPVSKYVKSVVQDRLLNELDLYDDEIGQAKEVQTFYDISNRLVKLEQVSLKHTWFLNEIHLRKDQIRKRIEEIEYLGIKQLFTNNSPDFKQAANTFLAKYPESNYKREVEEMLNRKNDKELNDERTLIRGMPVTDDSTLEKKYQRINSFLERFDTSLTPKVKQDMQRAVGLAKQFCENTTYSVVVKNYGGFNYAEDLVFTIKIKNQEVRVFGNDKGKAMEFTPNETVDIQWKFGDEVDLVLEAYGGILIGGKSVAGKYHGNADQGIWCFVGKTLLWPEEKWQKYADTSGFHATFQVEGLSEKDKTCFENYILPGKGW